MKFCNCLVLFSIIAGIGVDIVAAAEGHKCACEAEELGFTIDCDNTAAILTAMAALQADGCSANCSSEGCATNFLIVQSHHDYCPEAALPAEVEDGFHDFDSVCEACDISRPPDASLPDCPMASCDDDSGNTAYTALIADGCLSNGCNDTLCQENFLILKVAHDNCPEGTLTTESEQGIHDLEDACVAAGVSCNSGGGDNPLECTAEDHQGEEEAAAADGCAAVVLGLAGIVVGVSTMLLA